MKKITLTLSLILLGISASFAINTDDFNIDVTEYNQRIEHLDELESIAYEKDLTLTQINADASLLNPEINLDRNYSGLNMAEAGEKALGIPSFVWGLCVGVVGIAVVYFVTEDNEETKKALWGCLVGGVVYGLFYIIYVALIVSSATI